MPRASAIVALALALLVASPARAELRGASWATLGPGLDTNPRRTVGVDSPPDGFLGLFGSARGRLTAGEGHLLAGQYDVGLRKFFVEAAEDLAVQQGELSYDYRAGRLALGSRLNGKLRLTRASTRNYADASGEAYADWAVARPLSLRLGAGARAFRYPPDDAYSSFGPQARLSLRWAPSRRHSLAVVLSGARLAFEGTARLADGTQSGDPRHDRQLGAQLAYGYRGPLALQVSYGWVQTRSNSYGESTTRHRLTAAASVRLPWKIYAMAQAAVQLIRYPDGIYFSNDLLVALDEDQSSLALKLARPLSAAIELEARYALYWIELPPRGETGELEAPPTYGRQVASAGLVARW